MSAVNDGVMVVRASEAASAASATDTHQHTSGNVSAMTTAAAVVTSAASRH